MKVIKVKNYEELSRTAATIIAGVILSKPDCILGLATGSSPVGTYDQLAAMYEEEYWIFPCKVCEPGRICRTGRIQ